jgi:transcriptional antiterminator NusG
MESTTIKTNWYTLKVQNNHEKKISDRLKKEAERKLLQARFLVPTQRIYSVVNGKRVFKDKVMISGYIFVETPVIDKTFHMIRELYNGVNFMKNKDGMYHTLKQREIDKILADENTDKTPMEELRYIVGERVTILHSSFEGFEGVIKEISDDKKTYKVFIKVFGREAPIELQFDDFTKLKSTK